jgi:ATP-dependent helicase/nuclease subunit A
VSLTAEQHRAARTIESVAITAGAGSGKTHVLAERIIALLERGLHPLEICAVTFTDAAALELRERIERYVIGRLELDGPEHDEPVLGESVLGGSGVAGTANANSTGTLERERWGAILDALPAAQVSTIHSLCARIAREHPSESGTGFEFHVMDEPESRTWLKTQLRELLRDLPDAPFQTMSARTVFKTLEALLGDADSAKVAFNALESHEPEALLAAWSERLRLEQEARRNALRPAFRDAWQMLKTLSANDPNDTLERMRQALLSAIDTNRQDFTTMLEAIEIATTGFRMNLGSGKTWGPTITDARKAIKALRDIATDKILRATISASDTWLARAICALRPAFGLILERLDALKSEQEVMAFSDVLRAADRALEHASVRAYYSERFSAVLIDEFQDTNPMQWRILERLAHNTNLTIVGDEKQSIYAFTGARTELFAQARSSVLERNGIQASLRTSFRTHARLVNSLNDTFENLFSDSGTTFEALTAARDINPATPLEPIELHLVTGDAPIEKLRTAEATLIARRIRDLIASERPIHDKQTDTHRPVQAADIAVLFRSRTDLYLYEDALAIHGVPYVSDGGNLLERREIKDVRALLDFLENPSDNLALATILRSAYYAISDDDLLELARQRDTNQTKIETRSTLWHALEHWDTPARTILATHTNAPDPIQLARTTLQLLLENRHLPADQLVLKADGLTGHTATLAQQPAGERRIANIARFTAQLREWNISNLSALRQHLSDLDHLETRLSEAADAQANAVQLSTMHGSKGLEYPIVIVADIARLGRQTGRETIRFEPDQGLALKPDETIASLEPELREDNAPIPHLWRWLEATNQIRENAEIDRLLYVACTRARDLLILTSPHKVTQTYSPGKLEAFAKALPDAGVQRFIYSPSDLIPDIDTPLKPHTRLEIPTPHGEIILLPDTLTVTSLHHYLHCPLQFQLRHLDGLQPLERDWRTIHNEGEQHTRAANVGTITHRALEMELQTPEDLARVFPTLPQTMINEIANLIQTARALIPKVETREQSLTITLDGITLEGIIDATQPDGQIIDYKTDRHINPEQHLVQLAIYAHATKTTTATLAYLRHNTLHTFKPADLERGLHQAQTALHGIRQATFTATPNQTTCQHCAFNHDCPSSTTTTTAPNPQQG